MLSDLPLPSFSNDLVLLPLYIGVALAMTLYVYVTFVAPRLRERAAPDYDAKTRDLIERYRTQELGDEPDFVLPGGDLDAPSGTPRALPESDE